MNSKQKPLFSVDFTENLKKFSEKLSSKVGTRIIRHNNKLSLLRYLGSKQKRRYNSVYLLICPIDSAKFFAAKKEKFAAERICLKKESNKIILQKESLLRERWTLGIKKKRNQTKSYYRKELLLREGWALGKGERVNERQFVQNFYHLCEQTLLMDRLKFRQRQRPKNS